MGTYRLSYVDPWLIFAVFSLFFLSQAKIIRCAINTGNTIEKYPDTYLYIDSWWYKLSWMAVTVKVSPGRHDVLDTLPAYLFSRVSQTRDNEEPSEQFFDYHGTGPWTGQALRIGARIPIGSVDRSLSGTMMEGSD